MTVLHKRDIWNTWWHSSLWCIICIYKILVVTYMVQKNILLAFGIKQLVTQKICMINCQTGADFHNNLHQSIISYILRCIHNHCNFFTKAHIFCNWISQIGLWGMPIMWRQVISTVIMLWTSVMDHECTNKANSIGMNILACLLSHKWRIIM